MSIDPVVRVIFIMVLVLVYRSVTCQAAYIKMLAKISVAKLELRVFYEFEILAANSTGLAFKILNTASRAVDLRNFNRSSYCHVAL